MMTKHDFKVFAGEVRAWRRMAHAWGKVGATYDADYCFSRANIIEGTIIKLATGNYHFDKQRFLKDCQQEEVK